MKFGSVLGRSFKALGTGSLWAYGVTAFLAVAAPFALVWAALAATGAPSRLAGFLDVGPADAGMMSSVVTMYATLIVGGLLALLPMLVARGGLIHAADAALARRSFSVGECWGFGLRRLGRTLGIELLLGIAYMVAILVAEIPLFLMVALVASASGDDNPAAAIGGVCCGYLLFFAVVIVIVMVYMGVEGMAIRYGLIGDRTVGRAISDGFKAFKAAWKKVLVFALIMLAMAYGWQLLTSMITAPLFLIGFPYREFMSSGAPDPAAMSGFFDSFMWVYAAMIALYAPFTLFNAVAWTSFFRQLTGLEAPEQPPSAVYPSPYAGQAGYPAEPPAPPAGPAAPPAEPPAPMPPAPPAEPPAPMPPAPPQASGEAAGAEPPAPPAAPQPPPAPPEPPTDG